MRVDAVRAMFDAGALGWLEATRRSPLGLLARASLDQIECELEQSFGLGSEQGDANYAPRDLLPGDRDVVRDSCMGTMGGGNHFLEVQVVEEIVDGPCAFAWGIRRGQIAVMIHSGSRRVGAFVGGEWMDRARERWPAGVAYPPSGIFALHGEDASKYVTALHTAANYANVNRLLLAELARDRTRQVIEEAPAAYKAIDPVVGVQADVGIARPVARMRPLLTFKA